MTRRPSRRSHPLADALGSPSVITVVSDDVKRRLRRTVEVIYASLEHDVAEQLLNKLDEVWQ